MQLAALAAADLGLKRGREEERILRQLQGLRAGIRRVRGDDNPSRARWMAAKLGLTGLPAMAIALACIAVVQLGWPTAVRPHLIPPDTATSTVSVNVSTARVGHNGELAVPVTDMPGAWIISNQTITPSGKVFVLPDVPACNTGTQQQCNGFLATEHLRRRSPTSPPAASGPSRPTRQRSS